MFDKVEMLRKLICLGIAFMAAALVYLGLIWSEMTSDEAVVRRCAMVFGFWCAVIAVSLPFKMGLEILGKAGLLGILAMAISVACQWSYQFAVEGVVGKTTPTRSPSWHQYPNLCVLVSHVEIVWHMALCRTPKQYGRRWPDCSLSNESVCDIV